ncbi:MAG: efflux RND transporter periplasmic adaptor subunit [Proteobacteria bacterium]|nr:efflux RND transporter periplasmic adaptor subunit [Pseudomonadota bacterium]
MNKKLKIALPLVILLVIGILTYFFFFREKKQEITYTPATVTRGDITRIVEVTGIIKPQVGAQVKVGTRATGTLIKLRYQVGDYVKKGELIALIDDRQILSDLDNAKASLKYAEDNYKLIKDTYPLKIAEQEATLKSLNAQKEYATTNLNRQLELFKRGFATQDEIDRAKKEADVAVSNYEQALTTLKRLKEEYQRQLELAQSNIDQAQARIKNLEVNLTYTRIYSPINGIVSQVATQEGETVVAGLSAPNLITLLDPNLLEIWIYVDETDIGKVKVGLPIEYKVDAYRDKVFQGTISAIYPQPEIKDNIVYYLATVKIKPEDAKFLRPEMTTHVKIFTETKKNVLLVPNPAVKFEKGEYIVFIPKGKAAEPVPVKVGIRDEKMTEIISGLKENDKILIEKKPIPQIPVSNQPQQGRR